MEILIILFLIILNGVFSMSEIALVSSRKSKLEIEAKNGDAKAQAALDLASSPNRFLSTVQIGITLISILTGIYSGEQFTAAVQPFIEQFEALKPYSKTLSFGSITLILTFFSLVLGELVPKRIGMAAPEAIAKAMAAPMNVLSKITSPFIYLLTKSSELIFKLFGMKENDTSVTEEEIKSLIQEGATGGTIDEIEHEIVQNVFHLGDRRITSLMTNRNDVTFLDIDDGVQANLEKIINKRHSVYPVCNDGIDNMVGLLYIKDLLGKDIEETLGNLESLTRDPLLIPENNQTYQVLEKFQEGRIHFGMILDEYGSVLGIITLNDILDALVGDISETNEFEYEVTEREDGSFLVDASLPFDDFLNVFSVQINNRKEYTGFDTLGGFCLHILKEIPDTGDTFKWEEFKFEIIDMDKNRIDKILISKIDGKIDNNDN